jgi:hypothetical protein
MSKWNYSWNGSELKYRRGNLRTRRPTWYGRLLARIDHQWSRRSFYGRNPWTSRWWNRFELGFSCGNSRINRLNRVNWDNRYHQHDG